MIQNTSAPHPLFKHCESQRSKYPLLSTIPSVIPWPTLQLLLLQKSPFYTRDGTTSIPLLHCPWPYTLHENPHTILFYVGRLVFLMIFTRGLLAKMVVVSYFILPLNRVAGMANSDDTNESERLL